MLLVHAHLPEDRDPLWDHLERMAIRFHAALAAGTSLGLAYHLAVDATVDGMTPYKGLPVSAPMAVHRAALLGSAAAEVLRWRCNHSDEEVTGE